MKLSCYFHGVSDARTCVLVKLSSGTHGLSEELGRNEGRYDKCMCTLCAKKPPPLVV